MGRSKQKIIYELIRKDLKDLGNKKSELAKEINKLQRDEYNDSLLISIFDKQARYYKQLLPIVSHIIRKIGLPNNSISYSQIIENLIFDGYLSFGESLTPYEKKDNIKPIDLCGFSGVDVIRREGCCRNFAGIHQDIFHKLHLYNNIFYCYAWELKKSFVPPINEYDEYFMGNHTVNLIKYNGQFYIHDSYNQLHFSFKNCFTAKQYENKDNQSILYYTPVTDKLFNNKSYKQILNQMKSFEESSQKPHIDINELNEIIDETNDRFYNSTKLLSDFREEALPYMKKIVSLETKH